MTGDRWGGEAPPLEAYARVTEPERFHGLHEFAVDLLGRLESTFDVEREEGYGLDDELETDDRVRPGIKLVPRSPDAAPMVVVVTAFPGLAVRFGRWRIDRFPTCGCDACDETGDGESARLTKLVDDVTEGRFREAIGLPLISLPFASLPLIGRAWVESELWSPKGHASRRQSIDRSRVRQMLSATDRPSFEWGPWPPYGEGVPSDIVVAEPSND